MVPPSATHREAAVHPSARAICRRASSTFESVSQLAAMATPVSTGSLAKLVPSRSNDRSSNINDQLAGRTALLNLLEVLADGS